MLQFQRRGLQVNNIICSTYHQMAETDEHALRRNSLTYPSSMLIWESVQRWCGIPLVVFSSVKDLTGPPFIRGCPSHSKHVWQAIGEVTAWEIWLESG